MRLVDLLACVCILQLVLPIDYLYYQTISINKKMKSVKIIR